MGSCTRNPFSDHGYGTRSVVVKALRTGYYWPTMHKDARALKRACQDCQIILDFLEERREQAAIREAKARAEIENTTTPKVRSTTIRPEGPHVPQTMKPSRWKNES
ncbi:reverse transcriptase domain-containing protein [Tanacetum coccineum]